jgi:hypothetical protein
MIDLRQYKETRLQIEVREIILAILMDSGDHTTID